jgi:hypothetical protein
VTLYTRAQMPATLLPTAAPTAPIQPGTIAQLLAFAGRAYQAHSPNATIAFAQTNGETLRLPISDMQTMVDVSGGHYLVGSFCVPLNAAFITGTAPEWGYAMPIAGSTIASGGFIL